jgi:hypothetical protein
MAGGTKPLPASKVKNTSQDGAHKGGGVNTARHAGPKRASKTPPKARRALSCSAEPALKTRPRPRRVRKPPLSGKAAIRTWA